MSSRTFKSEPPPPELIKINPNSLVLWRPRKKFCGKGVYDVPDTVEETTSISKPPPPPRKNISNGFLSDRAGNRLRKSIKYLLWLAGCYKLQSGKLLLKPSGHISFITLTLCYTQLHSDNYIKRFLLNQFLTELIHKYSDIIFIWRAEKQNNGNIHFHLLVNHFVPWKWISATWNRLLKKEGYLLGYQVKFRNMSFEEYVLTKKDFKIDLLPKYRRQWKKGNEEDWSCPPSTFVEDMRTAKSIVYYMSKYLTKNSHKPENLSKKDVEKLAIQGHTYFCSQQISQIESPQEMLSDRILYELDILYSNQPDIFLFEEFYTVIKIPIEEVFNAGCWALYNFFAANINFVKRKKGELF